jgi:hypothetical protein
MARAPDVSLEDTMNRSIPGGRRTGGALAAGALLAATFTAMGAPAQAATHTSTRTAHSCGQYRARIGHFGGITPVLSIRTGCPVHRFSDPANGTPPLLFHGGKVMGTPTTGSVVVTPIYWNPAGHPMDAAYKSIITGYIQGVSADSNSHTNVFSTLTDYFGTNGHIRYRVTLGTAVNDQAPLPANGCTVAGDDTKNIYADGTGYNACIDDNQVIAETERVVTSRGLPRDLAHIYVLYLPKHVESCFNAGGTTTAKNQCTINHHPSAAFCAYHSQAPSGAIYANLDYPIYASPTGFTCSSDAVFPVVQAPNGNPDADTEVSPTSHETMEAITDPDVSTGWFDSSGFENGDECAFVFGPTQGAAGAFFNQVINGHDYLTQEGFSNNDFFKTGAGCLQSE